MGIELLLILIAAGMLAGLLAWPARWTPWPGSHMRLPRLSAVMIRNPDSSTSICQGEVVLSLPRQREGLALNPVAARCWELIDGHRSLRSIADSVAHEYDVEPEVAREEVLRFAGRLRAAYHALEAEQWELIHTHFSDLFWGAREEGIREIRRGELMTIHLAAGAIGEEGSPSLRGPAWLWRLRRRAARKVMARHLQREAPLREAMEAFEAGWAHSGAGRLAEAEERFRRAAALAPGWANPRYQLGYVFLRARRYREALQELTLTEQMSPGFYMVREYLDLATKLAEGRLSFEAFHLFERAARAEPADPDAVIALARRALELSPQFPSARLVLGRAYARKKDYEKALAELRDAIRHEPDLATLCNALYARGSIFMARGMQEQALREFEKVIELNGSPVATRSAMAHLASSGTAH